MHQRSLRTVLLIQAIEETDRAGEVIALADRADASRAVVRESSRWSKARSLAVPPSVPQPSAPPPVATQPGGTQPSVTQPRAPPPSVSQQGAASAAAHPAEAEGPQDDDPRDLPPPDQAQSSALLSPQTEAFLVARA